MTLVELVLAVMGSSALTALITGWLNRRKVSGDIDHTSVDTAADAIAMVRGAHGERIAELERQVEKLTRSGESDRVQIIALNRRLGEVMLGAEQQSRSIMELNDQVCLWRSRVSELLCVLRERQLPLPEWAMAQ